MSTGRSAYAVAQTEIGLGIEATVGTAAPATEWVPVKSPKYKPVQDEIPDETLQGSMVDVYNLIPGMRYDSHGWDSNIYLDSFPLFLMAELGSADNVVTASSSTTLAAAALAGATTVTLTAAVHAKTFIVIGSGGTIETHYVTAVSSASPYTATLQTPLEYAQADGATVTGLTSHQFSLLNNAGVGNQPPSMTIWDYDGEEWRTLTASQLDELTIKGNATGLCEYTCSWFANAATTPSSPTPAFVGTHTPAPFTAQLLIGGTQVGTVIDWEFDFKRGVKPIPALTGSKEYLEFFANTLQCTGKLTFVEQSGSPYLASYLNNTNESIDITVNDVASGYALNVHSSSALYKTGELDRGKEWVEVPIEFQLLPTTTDALAGGVSPVIATVANAQTAAYAAA